MMKNTDGGMNDRLNELGVAMPLLLVYSNPYRTSAVPVGELRFPAIYRLRYWVGRSLERY